MTHQDMAAAAWPMLVTRAKEGRTITYGELAAKIGTHHRPLCCRPMGYIWTYCAQVGIPHLNAIVVNKQTKRPGRDYKPPCKWEEMRDAVFAHTYEDAPESWQ